MNIDKKSILNKLFKKSGGCNCGIEIVEEEGNEKKSDDKKKKQK